MESCPDCSLYLPAVLTEFIVETVMIYAVIGVLFAAAFAWRGVAVVDPVARHATRGFRLLVAPGAALLWPLLMVRWWRAAARDAGDAAEVPGDRTERWQPASERLRSRALLAWIVLAPLVALALLVAIRSRAERLPETRDAGRLPEPAVERSARP